ncbi:MAG: hypothetical protein FD153_1554 [Rhodospirillaceae bacterium]|nr:MAG: hypothetical protein FD153_1554 [Rhodospirillaceae bacterium]
MCREQQVAAHDIAGAGLFYGSYHLVFMERWAGLEQNLAGVRALIAQAQEELAEVFHALKIREITQANHDLTPSGRRRNAGKRPFSMKSDSRSTPHKGEENP